MSSFLLRNKDAEVNKWKEPTGYIKLYINKKIYTESKNKKKHLKRKINRILKNIHDIASIKQDTIYQTK